MDTKDYSPFSPNDAKHNPQRHFFVKSFANISILSDICNAKLHDGQSIPISHG
ncbi:hypothetical protein [uncultured Duncaniella sp.]|uniref:hypothetical protein n=1 Tax=uncultured Duncaniella sp. TaxID=2768039 RepID=UPI002610A4D0|nr:hypothetical protein [uncultured Duncaniella sp.]